MPGSKAKGMEPVRSRSTSRQISARFVRNPFGDPSRKGEFAKSAVVSGESRSATRIFSIASASELKS